MRPVMVVTGGSRGIGAAVARRAAATYDVALVHAGGVATAALVADLERSGAAVLDAVVDVADEDAVAGLFRTIDARYGRLDALINNAAIAGTYGTIATVSASMLDRLWAVNLTGPFLCAREAVARMRTDQGGRGGVIVNVSSRAAQTGGTGEWVHYAASKGGLDVLTVGLAREVVEQGIRVVGVRPGLVDSDFHRFAPAGRLDRVAATIPMGRAGTPDEIAAAICWLASPEASYVTGSILDVGGGR